MSSDPLAHQNIKPPVASVGMRLRVFLGLLLGDFRAVATWISTMYPSVSPVGRVFRFLRWPVWQMWCEIPDAHHVTHEWSGTVSYTPDEYPIVGLMDGHRQYIIGGMASSGTGVSFNAGRCIVNRILGFTDEADDYPPEYFAPTRLLDPQHHMWPALVQ